MSHFTVTQFARNGVIRCDSAIEDVFPLLCPKREEEWIPGWECETIWSKSGYNEEGAIFRTRKPFGTELYWTTLRYDQPQKIVDFLIVAPHRYQFRFTIDVHVESEQSLLLTFTHVFTSVSEEGNQFLAQYQKEDFAERLKNLETLLNHHLKNIRTQRKDQSCLSSH